MPITTGFVNSNGQDIGANLVEMSYLIDRYPEMLPQFRFAGLWVWGYNGSGQLGNNSTVNKSTPVQTVAYGEIWKQVSVGSNNIGAIKSDSTLWTWGYGADGCVGDNTTTNRSSPVQTVAFGTNWKQVSVANYHMAAIKTDGTLWIWGRNNYGQLGDNTTTSRSSPVQTVTFGTNWKQVACGGGHTAAIKTDGTLWAWGYNSVGELGTNDTTNRSSPIQTVAFGTNWKQVSCNFETGAGLTSAVKSNGTLWSWGYNNFGGLGDNTITNRSSPVQTVTFGTNWKQVSTGWYHCVAIKTDGTLWAWGYNEQGQLGDNTKTYRSSPVQTVTFGTNWKEASAGGYVTSAIKTDGTLWMWGSNNYGQLATNDIIDRSSPIQTVAYGTNWKQISSSGYATAAIKDDSEDLY